MKGLATLILILALAISIWSCSKKEPDAQPNYPAYLRVPGSLAGYTGSGRISITGGLTLLAEGPEVLDPTTRTYTGTSGKISTTDVYAYATFGQPLPFTQTYSVPAQYEANGQLLIHNATSVGTYPMGFETKPTATGAQVDIILNLPGPQLYTARSGSLTITESTLAKTENQYQLYRIQGTFQTSLAGNGTGAKDTNVTGTFDLLLLN